MKDVPLPKHTGILTTVHRDGAIDGWIDIILFIFKYLGAGATRRLLMRWNNVNGET